MTTNLESQIAQAARGAVVKAIESELTGYNKPLNQLVSRAIDDHSPVLRQIVSAALAAVLESDSFRAEVEAAIRAKLARSLVGKMGGEIEKRINGLRSDPERRARITLALGKMIEEIGGADGD